MNCSESEKLFDAYLEGELRGSLRLEFEAHRVRCAQCQQTIAMLEAIGSVVSSEDPELPELSTDFSDRVLAKVQPARTVKFRHWKVVAVGATLVQAAAVLTIAVLWSSSPDMSIPPLQDDNAATVNASDEPWTRAGDDALESFILDELSRKAFAAGRNVYSLFEDSKERFVDVTGYANVELPPDLARDSRQMAARSPLEGFLAVFTPTPPPSDAEEETADQEDEIHAI
jgi:hypothetical protein